MPQPHRATPEDSIGRPQPIKQVLADLMLRRGYAREQSTAAFQAAWEAAAGEFLAGHTRCGVLRRGVLEVAVANSILMQEITYRKAALLEALQRLLPEAKIHDIRLRVGVVR